MNFAGLKQEGPKFGCAVVSYAAAAAVLGGPVTYVGGAIYGALSYVTCLVASKGTKISSRLENKLLNKVVDVVKLPFVIVATWAIAGQLGMKIGVRSAIVLNAVGIITMVAIAAIGDFCIKGKKPIPPTSSKSENLQNETVNTSSGNASSVGSQPSTYVS